MPPAKSAAPAGFAPLPATDQLTFWAALVRPLRWMVKAYALLPLLPSVWLAVVAITAKLESSLRITPSATGLAMLAPADAPDKVTAKRSLSSPITSAAMLTVTVLLVSPAAKLTLPDGAMPPAKSAALAGTVPLPLAPVAAQATVCTPAVPPLRVTVKV